MIDEGQCPGVIPRAADEIFEYINKVLQSITHIISMYRLGGGFCGKWQLFFSMLRAPIIGKLSCISHLEMELELKVRLLFCISQGHVLAIAASVSSLSVGFCLGVVECRSPDRIKRPKSFAAWL